MRPATALNENSVLDEGPRNTSDGNRCTCGQSSVRQPERWMMNGMDLPPNRIDERYGVNARSPVVTQISKGRAE